jgi:hypothetical protein
MKPECVMRPRYIQPVGLQAKSKVIHIDITFEPGDDAGNAVARHIRFHYHKSFCVGLLVIDKQDPRGGTFWHFEGFGNVQIKNRYEIFNISLCSHGQSFLRSRSCEIGRHRLIHLSSFLLDRSAETSLSLTTLLLSASLIGRIQFMMGCQTSLPHLGHLLLASKISSQSIQNRALPNSIAFNLR